jgi:uncharacterized protein YigA (DUF484 family)
MSSDFPSNDFSASDLPLTDELVSDYLTDHPDFFNRNPTLLSNLRVIDNHRGTISLVERQQQQLRQKNHILEEEITQLMSIAHHNERLFAHYSDLYLRLLDCKSLTQLLDCLLQTTTDVLSLAGVKLWLTQETDITHTALITNDCTGVMHNRLANDAFYFGRLQQTEQELIFSQHSLGSVVLIKLSTSLESTEQNTDVGFLAISSDDAEHFDPRMDTLLLSQFRKLIAKLVQQHLVTPL